jgi:transposase
VRARRCDLSPLIGTAKLNGVDPEAWSRYMLGHMADHPVNCVAQIAST